MRRPTTVPFWSAGYPPGFTGNEAWYDASDITTMRNNAGAVPSNGEGIKLWADKSGNSSVNVLCLNGVAGNYASAPDSVPLSIAGDIHIRTWLAVVSLTGQYLFTAKDDAATQRSYSFGLENTGRPFFAYSNDGSSIVGRTANCSVAISTVTSALTYVGLGVNYNSSTGKVNFEYSTDGTTWSALGAEQTITSGAIFDGTAALSIGQFRPSGLYPFSGNIHRVQIWNGIIGSGGTLAFDANFTTASKLAPSFTESSSNAATVTINNSGSATGARISGARDLYQGVAASQPILTIAAGGNYLTFDGSNDYLKAAAFALAQPETVYFVGSQVTWTTSDTLFDGNSASERMFLAQSPGGASPQLAIYAGSYSSVNSGLATATRGVVTSIFNNASSFIRVNRGATTTGTIGSQSGNGFTLGAAFNAVGPANITASEVLVYSTAQNTAQQDAVILYEGRKWGLSV